MSDQVQEFDLEIRGVRLHVARVGTGDKQPVVLVHGFSDSGRCWPQMQRDLSEKYDVILPDSRGHGRSARMGDGGPMDMPLDLAGIIEALSLVRPIVIGHSMGAATAAQLAARFPDSVGALVLEDPPWHPLPETPAMTRVTPKDVDQMTSAADPSSPSPPLHSLAQWIASLDGLPAEEVVRQNRNEHPVWPDEVLRRWSEAKLQLDREFFFHEAAHPMAWPEIVDAIRCPTLLITSDPDRGGIMTPSLVQQVLSRNQNFQWVQIDGVGHHIRFEAYDRYREAVMAFLSVCEG